MENYSFSTSASLDHNISYWNTSTEDSTLEIPFVVVLCTVLGLASVVGTVGNFLVLLSIIKFDDLRDIPDFFIFSLSLSDTLVTTIYQPLKTYRLAHLEEVSTFMDILRASSSLLGHISLIASISNMFGVTMERLISIRFPLKYDFLVTKKRATIVILFIWIFSISYGVMWSEGLAPNSYLSIYFIAVLIGTILIYVYIFLIARRLERSVAHVQNGSTDENRSSSNLKDRKTAKTIAIILGVATASWLPFLIIPRFLTDDQDLFFTVFSFLQVLSVCNSSINPYIYCARSRRYYLAFIKLLGLQNALFTRVQVTQATFRVSPPDHPSTASQDPYRETDYTRH